MHHKFIYSLHFSLWLAAKYVLQLYLYKSIYIQLLVWFDLTYVLDPLLVGLLWGSSHCHKILPTIINTQNYIKCNHTVENINLY